MPLADQAARDRFAQETARNFSVLASAGAGKTTALASRVVEIARADAALPAGAAPRLPRLAVVTYTRKAADELRDRSRRALVETGVRPRVLGWFNQAFFGTIHSFCLELLRRFGPLAGVPARLALSPDDAAAWLAFQRDTPDPAAHLPDDARAAWRQFGDSAGLWRLARSWPGGEAVPPPPGPCPPIELGPLLAFQLPRKNKRTEETIRRERALLERWRADAASGALSLGVPATGSQSKEYAALWEETFQPLRAWLGAAAAHAAAGLAAAHLRHRDESGRAGFDDFVRLACGLLRDAAIAERVRAAGYSVLLDEAQDTAPAQFAVLVGVAQPPGAPGLWAEGAGAPPGPGRFSMVGDPQQSIYDTADVAFYRALHDRLLDARAAEKLEFSVTMRCDSAVVAGVNEIFPVLLDGRDGQALFEKMNTRPDAGPGAVWKLRIAAPSDLPAKPKVDDLTRTEARALARWLARAGPRGAGADGWENIAVLAPRRAWLEILAAELQSAGLRAQIHTGERAPGADPARAWLGTLAGLLAEPADAFEAAGALREIYGLSDDLIYHYVMTYDKRARPGPEHPLGALLAPPQDAAGPVAAALRQLHRAQTAAAGLPLRDAIALAVESTRLRARLALLPDAPAPGARVASLDALLDQAAAADARGETLAQFARVLREGPLETVEAEARAGEIQLLTSYKAKGLQWPVVILFGLFREPKRPSPEYPRWAAQEDGAPPACFYDKEHAAASGAGAREADGQRAAFERLLYVAATRPRTTLIAVDAEALGADVKSLADVLGLLPGGRHRAWWEALPEILQVEIKSHKIITVSPTVVPAAELPWSEESVRLGLERAALSARRVRPSSLARHGAAPERAEPDLHSPPEYPEEQPLPAEAVNYGNWWHAAMETTPWSKGPEAWRAHWDAAAGGAPDPERARAELDLLLASPLAARLAAPGLEFLAELPFLWPEPGGARAFDGCMDLAVWDSAARRWLIIDWKTDRTEGDPAAELRARYGAQIAVYARAIGAIFDSPAEALLYGTRVGLHIETTKPAE